MRKEVVEQVAALITTAFGLVAALAWNGAIQEWFASQDTLRAGGPWVYAILVTAVAVGVTIWIGRVAARMDKEEEEKEAA